MIKTRLCWMIPCSPAVVAVALLCLCHEDEDSARRAGGPCRLEEVMALAADLNLYCECDPPGRWPTMKIVLSEHSGIAEFMPNLLLNERHFGPWKGTVGVWRSWEGSRPFYEANFDPAHPERYALWGSMFVFGDPQLIKRLRESWQAKPTSGQQR